MELEALDKWKHGGQFFGEFREPSGCRHLILEAMEGVGDGQLNSISQRSWKINLVKENFGVILLLVKRLLTGIFD
jgi:hypothetical protein